MRVATFWSLLLWSWSFRRCCCFVQNFVWILDMCVWCFQSRKIINNHEVLLFYTYKKTNSVAFLFRLRAFLIFILEEKKMSMRAVEKNKEAAAFSIFFTIRECLAIIYHSNLLISRIFMLARLFFCLSWKIPCAMNSILFNAQLKMSLVTVWIIKF